MTIATWHDAVPLFGFAGLALAACAAPLLWSHWTVHGTRWALWVAAAITAVGAIVLAASGLAMWLLLVALMIGTAVLGRQAAKRGPRIAAAVVVAAAGVPLYAFTLLLALWGWATIGCAPDAYECPF